MKLTIRHCVRWQRPRRGNTTWQNLQAFHAAATPEVVQALLDENERLCRDLIARNGEIEGLREWAEELEAREVHLPTRYGLRYGHPINDDERHVMIPKENGCWLYLADLEHALRVAGIHIKGEEYGNKTRR